MELLPVVKIFHSWNDWVFAISSLLYVQFPNIPISIIFYAVQWKAINYFSHKQTNPSTYYYKDKVMSRRKNSIKFLPQVKRLLNSTASLKLSFPLPRKSVRYNFFETYLIFPLFFTICIIHRPWIENRFSYIELYCRENDVTLITLITSRFQQQKFLGPHCPRSSVFWVQ